MKILQLMPEFNLAGAEIMAENLIYGLSERGCDVVPVSFYRLSTPITQRLEKNGFPVVYLDKKQGFDPKLLRRLRTLIKRENPDVIHSHRHALPYAFLASGGRKVSLVHTVHNIAQKEVPPFQQHLQWGMFRARNVTPVAISPLVKESILQRYNLPPSAVPLVYNGVNLKNCQPKTDYKLQGGGTILHIGRFSAQKNHLRLIDAFEQVHKQFPEVRLQLIGQGELESDVRCAVLKKELTPFVEFLGPQENVYPFLHAADVFVLPSDYEGMPVTLIEAMGTALPIVATRVGGVPDMITHEKSGLLTSCNAAEVASALVRLLTDENLRQTLGTSAQKDGARFSKEQMAQDYLEIYYGKNTAA